MWDKKWDEVYSTGWGAVWPDERLIRFCETRYPREGRKAIKVVDLGCGIGRNLMYLQTAGFLALGIEASQEAIGHALSTGLVIKKADLMDMPMLPDNRYDLCVDICSLQHNTTDSIKKILKEVLRVLKPGGILFSIVRSKNDSLYRIGKRLDDDSTWDIQRDDLAGKGVTRFFSDVDIYLLFKGFEIMSIDYEHRSINNSKDLIAHYIVVAMKPGAMK